MMYKYTGQNGRTHVSHLQKKTPPLSLCARCWGTLGPCTYAVRVEKKREWSINDTNSKNMGPSAMTVIRGISNLGGRKRYHVTEEGERLGGNMQ